MLHTPVLIPKDHSLPVLVSESHHPGVNSNISIHISSLESIQIVGQISLQSFSKRRKKGSSCLVTWDQGTGWRANWQRCFISPSFPNLSSWSPSTLFILLPETVHHALYLVLPTESHWKAWKQGFFLIGFLYLHAYNSAWHSNCSLKICWMCYVKQWFSTSDNFAL